MREPAALRHQKPIRYFLVAKRAPIRRTASGRRATTIELKLQAFRRAENLPGEHCATQAIWRMEEFFEAASRRN